jgi:hypothetical protein
MSQIHDTDPNIEDGHDTLNDPVSVSDPKTEDDPGSADDSIDDPVTFTVLDP